MFLYRVGDKIKLTKESSGILTKAVFNALEDDYFTITSIRTDSSCSDQDKNCSCDKFITVKNGPIQLIDLLSQEISLVDIKENMELSK